MEPVGLERIAALFAKERVTIVVTDSGLGGLSIFAEIAARLKEAPIFAGVTLVYYNAWPETNRGYHRLKDTAERIRVFDRALEGMRRYRPDIILIACNTLSVLYDRTPFSRRGDVPVIDIVGFGVDMVYEHLVRKADATALLLGTVTTIASDIHRSRLIEKGVSPDRLAGQPCDQLAAEIEKGPDSEAVAALIDRYMGQAAEMLPGRSRLFVALFCTHFGYVRELIRAKLEFLTGRSVTILDPNRRMADHLFAVAAGRRFDQAVLDLQVVSRIAWDQSKIDAIAPIIATRSTETADALRNYQWIPDLFTF